MTDADLQAVEVPEVEVLRLGPHDALVFRFPGVLSETALYRFRATVEGWSERTFGRKVSCLVLEDGTSVEVLRDAAGVAAEASPAMQRAEQEGIR